MKKYVYVRIRHEDGEMPFEELKGLGEEGFLMVGYHVEAVSKVFAYTFVREAPPETKLKCCGCGKTFEIEPDSKWEVSHDEKYICEGCLKERPPVEGVYFPHD
jgi:hypothetical protein